MKIVSKKPSVSGRAVSLAVLLCALSWPASGAAPSEEENAYECSREVYDDYTPPRIKLRRPPQLTGYIPDTSEVLSTDLTYCITAKGKTSSITIVKESGTPAWDRATKRAPAKWRWFPATVAGEPVKVCGCELTLIAKFEN